MDINNLNNTPDTTANYDPKDIEDNKVLALFSYIGLLFLIPLLAAKDSKYARFHVNQGIVLFIVDILIGVVSGVLGWIPILGILVGIVCGLAGICCLILAIIGIINAYNGKAKELPIIGKFRVLKDVDSQPAAQEAPAEEVPAVEEPKEEPKDDNQ
ncbi:MAG: DUF4870 domain-containing protein [Clostridia bacterium]|nr:DUF4870 domain-containing protein [Clostridia bacterium]